MVIALFGIADLILRVLGWIIIGQVILSWLVAFNVLNTNSQGLRAFVGALDKITEPLYRPIRKVMPDFGGIDFSPLVLLLVIQILRMLLGGVAVDLAASGAV
jgi:YggT family protein